MFIGQQTQRQISFIKLSINYVMTMHLFELEDTNTFSKDLVKLKKLTLNKTRVNDI